MRIIYIFLCIWHMYFSFTCKLLVHIFPTSKLPIPPLSSKQHEVLRKPPASHTPKPQKQTTKSTNQKINQDVPTKKTLPCSHALLQLLRHQRHPTNWWFPIPKRVQQRGFSRQILAPDIRELLGLPPPWQQIRVPWDSGWWGFWVKVDVFKGFIHWNMNFFAQKKTQFLLGEFCFNIECVYGFLLLYTHNIIWIA